MTHKGGGEGQCPDFWAMVHRDRVRLFLKAIAPGVHPQLNHSRHEWASWDAYINASDPDALYSEYVAAGVTMHRELENSGNGLRTFEVSDNNGYVLGFGRPLSPDARAAE